MLIRKAKVLGVHSKVDGQWGTLVWDPSPWVSNGQQEDLGSFSKMPSLMEKGTKSMRKEGKRLDQARSDLHVH